MILPQLIRQHLKNGDDEHFYHLQASDAMHWIQSFSKAEFAGSRILDLGCGHGIFGAELLKEGAEVCFSDTQDFRAEHLRNHEFLALDLDQDPMEKLGQFDGVVCSNVYEHLSQPARLLDGIPQIVKPGGWFFLSWTNWLSPWGGHEFSPFHFLGPRLGPAVFDKLTGKKRLHTPGENLFVTWIGQTLRKIHTNSNLKVVACFPRYYPELKWITSIPGLREVLTWNCALLIQRINEDLDSDQ